MLKLATRLAILEGRREAQVKAWLASLSEEELIAFLDESYGPGSGQWLCDYIDALSPAERDSPTFDAHLVQAFLQWRETQV
jgi:hypothetical protein